MHPTQLPGPEFQTGMHLCRDALLGHVRFRRPETILTGAAKAESLALAR